MKHKKKEESTSANRKCKSPRKKYKISIKMLAFFHEVVKGEKHNDSRTAFLIILAVLLGMKFAEMLGRWLAYNL